ncbi:hypothetical protein ACFX1X_022676 [Malus domestica]
MSIHSRLGSHSDSQHKQPSRQSVHSWLSPQGASFTSHWSRQHDERREAVTQSSSSSTSSLRRTHHMHCIRGIDEPNTWKSGLNQQVIAGGSRELCYPNKGKFRKK